MTLNGVKDEENKMPRIDSRCKEGPHEAEEIYNR